MISRIKIEGYGASAAEVEATLKVAYSLIQEALDPAPEVESPPDALVGPKMKLIPDPDDEMVIERDLNVIAHSASAFKGRMRLLLNVADDAGQVALLRTMGVDVTTHGWGDFSPPPPAHETGVDSGR